MKESRLFHKLCFHLQSVLFASRKPSPLRTHLLFYCCVYPNSMKRCCCRDTMIHTVTIHASAVTRTFSSLYATVGHHKWVIPGSGWHDNYYYRQRELCPRHRMPDSRKDERIVIQTQGLQVCLHQRTRPRIKERRATCRQLSSPTRMSHTTADRVQLLASVY